MAASPRHPERFGARSRAFSLVEMLVVIAVVAVTLSAVVPSVSRILQSSNYTGAVNAVTATLGRARAAAMESGRETAVAFLFDIKTRRYTLQVLERASDVNGGTGSIAVGDPQTDEPNGGEGLTLAYGSPSLIAVYQPLRQSAPIELPAGTAVFGLSQQLPSIDLDGSDPPLLDQIAPTNVIDPLAEANIGPAFDLQRWYAGEVLFDGNGMAEDNIIPWIFPRNDARLFMDEGSNPWSILANPTTGDVDAAKAAVRNAMSFAVAFNADGSTSSTFYLGATDAYIELPHEPNNEDGDMNSAYDAPAEFDPAVTHPTQLELTKPNPEVRLRTVNMLAVVDLQALEAGASVNRPWLVRPESSLLPKPPNLADPKHRFINNEQVLSLSDWIDQNALIISFNRYTGGTVKR